MGYLNKLSDSAGLVSGMASRLNVDLAERVAASPETAATHYRDLVQRCSHCRDQDACAKLQDENPLLDEAPDYCMNRSVFHSASGRE